MLAQHEIEHPLVLGEPVLQRDAFGQHLDPFNGFSRQIVEFRLTREVAIDEHDRHLIAAAAARQRTQRVDEVIERVGSIGVQFRG